MLGKVLYVGDFFSFVGVVETRAQASLGETCLKHDFDGRVTQDMASLIEI